VKPSDGASLPPNHYDSAEGFAAAAAAGQSGPVLANILGLNAGARKAGGLLGTTTRTHIEA